MKTAGLTAEFNPFHNGHKYILEEIRKHFDAVAVIMSGSFVQRGDIAVTDKYTRAAAALKNGADLVIELPVIYALNTAQRFAFGAVATLDRTGIIDSLVFGSESGDKEELITCARIMENESAEISYKIKKYMSSGMSYPSARAKAYEGIVRDDLISKPNNILALEYIQALHKIHSDMDIFTIKRTNVFHAREERGKIASAADIRKMMRENRDISEYVPSADFEIYDIKELDKALTYFLRTVSAGELARVNDVSEGIENRILSAAKVSLGFEEICAAVKAKRYTMSRVRRILLSSFLKITKEDAYREPEYIRILGMNKTGKTLLREMKSKAKLPVIIKAAVLKDNEIFKIERRASEAAAMCATAQTPQGDEDLRRSPIIF